MREIESCHVDDKDDNSKQSAADEALARADALGDPRASALVRIVARAHGVTVQELFHHSRSRAPIAATRQLAMYLMHVALGRSLTDVGRFFQRDRTTVSYACAIIEDLRDELEFEDKTAALENKIEYITSDPVVMQRFLAGEKAADQ